MTTREVTKCRNCPCFANDEWGNWCGLTLPPVSGEFDGTMRQGTRREPPIEPLFENATPDWCPLRNGAVTLRLKGGE